MRKMKTKKKNMFSTVISRFLVCIIICLIGLIVLKSNPNLKRFVYRNVFQNNLKFAKINSLYEKYFGSTLPLTGNNITAVSSEQLEYESEEKYEGGVKLKVSNNYAIPALKSGIVVVTGEKDKYGNTVVVQGADGVEIWYSNLKELKISMYDYIKKGSIIGEVSDNNLILVFTKDGKELDYKKYI